MNASVGGGDRGAGGGSWRVPPDETLQVCDPKDKAEQVIPHLSILTYLFNKQLLTCRIYTALKDIIGAA